MRCRKIQIVVGINVPLHVLSQVACSVLLLSMGVHCHAIEYYFSGVGNDLTGDGTIDNPWQTVDKFNSLELDPGESVFFRAGDTFDGRLLLDANDTGTNASGQLISPITIGSYNSSSPSDRAIIRSPANQEAFLASNNGGIELRDLELVNGGAFGSSSTSGVTFSLDQNQGGGLTRYRHIRVDNIVSHGFNRNGLRLTASGNVGYEDVEITNSEFYNNQFSGIEIVADVFWQSLIHKNVKVDNVVARNNPGFAGCSPHCGHGVVLGQIDGAIIENSAAHTNGAAFGKGNVGIWTWQSNDVTIQYNETYGNLSPFGGDGGGFDIDGGVTNSIIQYNVSRDNAGAGYLLAQFDFAEPMSQNIFRYNLSVNDGQDFYGAITVWGADGNDLAESTVFHNNTIILDKNVAPNARGAIWFLGTQHSEVDFFNNIFVALNGAELINGGTTSSKSTFANNAYWTGGAPLWLEGSTYASIADWAAAEYQEMVGGNFVGIEADPEFVDAVDYRLKGSSPLLDIAMEPGTSPWPAWLTNIGQKDLYATTLPQGLGFDLGAAESILGDFDGNGDVSTADFAIWQAGFGANYNGDDFLNWQLNFYFGNGSVAASQLVPEPTARILLSIGCAITLLLARRMTNSR